VVFEMENGPPPGVIGLFRSAISFGCRKSTGWHEKTPLADVRRAIKIDGGIRWKNLACNLVTYMVPHGRIRASDLCG
jgi:hypothetical protein